jgi:hypothetical protein
VQWVRRLSLTFVLALVAFPPATASAAFLSKAVAHIATEHAARRFERAAPELEWTVTSANSCARVSSTRVICGFFSLNTAGSEPESCDYNAYVRLVGHSVYTTVKRTELCDE